MAFFYYYAYSLIFYSLLSRFSHALEKILSSTNSRLFHTSFNFPLITTLRYLGGQRIKGQRCIITYLGSSFYLIIYLVTLRIHHLQFSSSLHAYQWEEHGKASFCHDSFPYQYHSTLCRLHIEKVEGIGYCTVKSCTFWGPRDVKAHGFESLPRSEVRLGNHSG